MRGISEKRLRAILHNQILTPDTQSFIQYLLEDECKELNPWLPIDENTPRDRELWLYWKSTGHMECAFYNHMCGQDAYPTHYQELPEAPL